MVPVEENRIRAVDRAENLDIPESTQLIDAQGTYVGPGFVDIHVHGGGKNDTYVEPILATISRT